MQSKLKVIGLTGGIASGKSTALNYLRSRGVAVVDADLIARQVVAVDQPAYQKIVARFGAAILNEDRTINRKALGAVVFKDAAERRALEAITHPAIISEIKRQIEMLQVAGGVPFIVLDVPLLFETGLQILCDQVWLVAVARAAQVKRLCRRDGIAEVAAERIINLQMPLEEKRKLADIVIDNNGSLADLQHQLDACYQAVQNAADSVSLSR